ncbi:MAG TPA: hypothetical protein VJR89_10150, partial [Polyangiales bacterium]|nr:hypothetical protein [Polyangiales bacterium]
AIVTREHAPLATLRPELPGSLLAAVERALRKIPNERFATAAQMCGALKALQPSAAGEPDVSSSQLQPPPAAPPQRPKPAATPLPRPAQPRAAVPVVAVALVALAGTACALGIFALRRSQVRQAAAQLTAAPAQQHAEPRPDRPSVAAKPPEQTVAPEPPLEAAEDDAPRTMLASAARPPAQGLRPEALARALAEREPGLQRCLHDAALAKRVAGESLDMLRLEVELAVAPSGDVEHVALRGDAPEELTSCLHARLSEAEFPRAESPSTFRYPLLLRTGGVGQ